MENTLLIGLSRQIALQRELDVVANNVANMNTTGYKADGAIFEEYLMPQAQAAGFQGADRRVSYVQDRATWRDFGSGPIRPTGNPLDVAIDGDAFFVVQTPRGERYTRNGAFQVNAQGELVTNTGERVVGDGGPIQFQSTDNSISINPDGTITAREGSNSRNDSARGRLRLVRFDNVQQLQKDGTTMTPDQRARAEKDLRDGARDLARKQGEVQDDFNARRTVLLCSEYSPMHCHRRLVVDYLQRHWQDVRAVHL